MFFPREPSEIWWNEPFLAARQQRETDGGSVEVACQKQDTRLNSGEVFYFETESSYNQCWVKKSDTLTGVDSSPMCSAVPLVKTRPEIDAFNRCSAETWHWEKPLFPDTI